MGRATNDKKKKSNEKKISSIRSQVGLSEDEIRKLYEVIHEIARPRIQFINNHSFSNVMKFIIAYRNHSNSASYQINTSQINLQMISPAVHSTNANQCTNPKHKQHHSTNTLVPSPFPPNFHFFRSPEPRLRRVNRRVLRDYISEEFSDPPEQTERTKTKYSHTERKQHANKSEQYTSESESIEYIENEEMSEEESEPANNYPYIVDAEYDEEDLDSLSEDEVFYDDIEEQLYEDDEQNVYGTREIDSSELINQEEEDRELLQEYNVAAEANGAEEQAERDPNENIEQSLTRSEMHLTLIRLLEQRVQDVPSRGMFAQPPSLTHPVKNIFTKSRIYKLDEPALSINEAQIKLFDQIENITENNNKTERDRNINRKSDTSDELLLAENAERTLQDNTDEAANVDEQDNNSQDDDSPEEEDDGI